MDPIAFIFWGTLLTTLLLDGTILATLTVPGVQSWPPPRRHTWQYRLTWTLFGLFAVGFLVVGGLDAGSLGLHRWLGNAGTHIIGSACFATGTAVACYAMGYQGHRGALGLEANLVTGGPYAVSRNPGYVGDLVLMVGYVLLSDSRLAGVLAAVGALWFILAPFAEEPWLERQYGDAYRHYKAHHPRFFGLLRREMREP